MNASNGGSITRLTACAGCEVTIDSDDTHTFRDIPGRYCKPCHDYLVGVFIPLEARGRTLNTYFKGKYGITFREYGDMYLRQKGRCAICLRTPAEKQLVVDHCHATSVVRGLLCASCNSGLGMFKDNVLALAGAIQYLCR